jgi:hypothetical protein
MKVVVLVLGLICSLIFLREGYNLVSFMLVLPSHEAYIHGIVGRAMIGISFFTTAISFYCFARLKSKDK